MVKRFVFICLIVLLFGNFVLAGSTSSVRHDFYISNGDEMDGQSKGFMKNILFDIDYKDVIVIVVVILVIVALYLKTRSKKKRKLKNSKSLRRKSRR